MSDQSQSAWDPGQYNRFAAEREQPFWDLAALVQPVSSPSVVDLGCGDGRLTAALHERLGAKRTLGIDWSPAMLSGAAANARDGVTFEAGDIGSWRDDGVDVVFSNAALQWVADHPRVLRQWREGLRPNGQLCVQMPSNADHASHLVSSKLADEWLGADAPRDPVAENVLRPEAYAELLHALGFTQQHVRLQVYGHMLPSSADVVEWVKGTSLTRFKESFAADDYARFVDEYRKRLLAAIGDRSPYFYAFRRILFWGRV
jgi:trans-aconitate 2-methyltransferase